MFSPEDASGAPGSVDQGVIKPFLLSARTLGPPDFTPEASPRVCCQTPAAIRVCTWGLSTCEGPAEPGARGRCPTGSVCGFPGSPPGARGPLAWPLGAPGSSPSGDLVIALRAVSPVDLQPGPAPGTGGAGGAGSRRGTWTRVFSWLPRGARCPCVLNAWVRQLVPWLLISAPGEMIPHQQQGHTALWVTRTGSQEPGTHGAFL